MDDTGKPGSLDAFFNADIKELGYLPNRVVPAQLHLLVPQGAKFFGRYDAKVSFGQSRVLVIWTDLVFPNGSTLQIGGMAGTDAEGYGGFRDKVSTGIF